MMPACPQFFDGTPDAFSHFSVDLQNEHDVDEVIDVLARAFKPHRMDVSGTRGSLNAQMLSYKVGRLQIFYLHYGAEVFVDPGKLDGFTLIQVPVRGSGHFISGRHSVSGVEGVAAILSPQDLTQMRFAPEFRQVIVRIDQQAIERACIEHLDRLPQGGISFDPKMDLSKPGGQAFRAAVTYVLDASLSFPDLLGRASYAERCERMLIDTLLFGQANTCSDQLDDAASRKTVRPAYVKRAEEYMREHVADITSVDEIARVVGVSPRALFYAFRQTYDQTPMAYLRELRLKAVHAELQLGDARTLKLIDVALRWGFAHYGHFAQHYRRRFGVRPQDTLKQR